LIINDSGCSEHGEPHELDDAAELGNLRRTCSPGQRSDCERAQRLVSRAGTNEGAFTRLKLIRQVLRQRPVDTQRSRTAGGRTVTADASPAPVSPLAQTTGNTPNKPGHSGGWSPSKTKARCGAGAVGRRKAPTSSLVAGALRGSVSAARTPFRGDAAEKMMGSAQAFNAMRPGHTGTVMDASAPWVAR
jgi:hypothetical protein